ncbi:MAG: linear amide C-N hydrolase [Bacteroidales bacterium]|nr:linear amide C-N hydrolase [Bacteroidales bacterium]
MNYKMIIKSILILCFLLGCSKKGNEQIITKITTPTSGIVGIQKVDDFPFYVMNYGSDYHFDDYLKTGTYPVFAQNYSIKEANVWGCTCFAAMGNINTSFFGRNFDWHDCIPMLLITKPENGYSSVSMVDLEYLGFTRNNLPDNPSTNQRLSRSPYLTFDGMNEKGVAIGMMAIEAAHCTIDPAKVTIEELEVIRLVLDYAASVDEAIELIGKYNIRFTNPPIHYMIADKSGKSTIIEFVGGEMKVIPNDNPWQVCTNFIVTGTSAPSNVSCWRYNKAHSELQNNLGIVNLDEAFKLVEDVSQSNTIWSMIYDLNNCTVSVSLSRGYSHWYQYNLAL